MGRKKKLERFREMKAFPNVCEISYTEAYNYDYPLKGKWNQEYFKNNAPIIAELGCGKGEYTINLARNFPDKNFIGIDIKGSRMYVGAKIALQESINNVLFIRTRIEFLKSIFSDHELSEIWLTFPDPHEKKTESKKRLSSSRFLNIYKVILGGEKTINLKTDNTILYDYTKAVLTSNNIKPATDICDVHNTPDHDKLLDIMTYYESLFIKENKIIHYIKFNLDHTVDYQEPEVEIGR